MAIIVTISHNTSRRRAVAIIDFGQNSLCSLTKGNIYSLKTMFYVGKALSLQKRAANGSKDFSL